MASWEDWYAALNAAMPRSWNPADEPRAPLSRWAQRDEILRDAWKWDPKRACIQLGPYERALVGRPDDNRHFMTVAGTRAGKGRSLVLPNLATWPGSAVVIDPKGELARKTARWRNSDEGLAQNVVILDPFGISGQPTYSYNPFDDLDPKSDTFFDDVGLVADGLIVNDTDERHWTDSAKSLIRTLIFYMFAQGGEVSLTRLRHMLLGGEGRVDHPPDLDSELDFLFCRMKLCDAFDDHIKLLAQSFLDKSERELDSIVSVAREQLIFLDSRVMPKVLRSSRFRLRSIKKSPTTVYMCLPAVRLPTHFRWLRIIVNLTLGALAEGSENDGYPVLLLLEEFATLGHMEAIEKAAGQIAGSGVKLWTVLQDIGQLKAIYKERWETFLGNSGATTWFGLNDLTSLEYVSNMLGDTHFLRKEKVDLTTTGRKEGTAEYRDVIVNSKLLSPEEVGRFFARQADRLLVLHPGSRPMVLKRLDAGDAMFKGRIDEHD